MLAFATNNKNQAKIGEKLHVFWDVDFGRILGGFWEGFGMPKTSIFALLGKFLGRLGRREGRRKKEGKKRGKRGRGLSTTESCSSALPV